MPRPGGSTRRYRRVRAEVLARDGWRCRMADVRAGRYLPHLAPWAPTIRVSPDCAGADLSQLQAHHVRGRAETGDDPRWMLAACSACNQATGDPRRRDAPPLRVTRW